MAPIREEHRLMAPIREQHRLMAPIREEHRLMAPIRKEHDIYIFVHQIQTFVHSRFSTTFFSSKVTESEKVVLQYCIIDFDDTQIGLIGFVLIPKPCKVMRGLFNFWPKNIKMSLQFGRDLN